MSANPTQTTGPQEFILPEDYHFSGDDCTVQRKGAFIIAFHQHGSIYHAAQACGVSRRMVYYWIEDDPEFVEAMSDAKENTNDDLEGSVFKRAFKSDLLAMFYLKAHRPKFRDKVMVDVSQVQQQIDEMVAKMDAHQRQQLPAVITEFVDTSFSDVSQEYQPVNNQPISHPSDNQQKEECGTCNIPNSE